MSVSSVVIVCSLVAQIAAGDRYGTHSGEPASPFSDPPAVTAPPVERSKVAPPPRFSPNDDAIDDADDTTPIADEPPNYRAPATQPSSPTRPTTQAANPSAMMASMLTAPAGARLTGRPFALVDVVAGAGSREAQSERIETYWDLCSAVADYYLGVREQDELQRMRSSTTAGPAWQQATAELGVRLATSQRAATASQYRLASLMGGVSGAGLPLPADLPHCGDYYARYDQVFAGRQSPEAQQLSELLPMRYEELCDASLAVTRAEQILNAVAARPSGDGTSTLQALELLALRRRAFVQIARDYNRRIERYTELASPGQIDTDRLIGMLIRRENSTNTATRPANLVPPPNRQSQLPIEEFVDPEAQTFAEGWESIKSASAEVPIDEDVKPASAESRRSKPRREHSLLVPSG
jgi:hypothetical protein